MVIDHPAILLAALNKLRPGYVVDAHNRAVIQELALWLALDSAGLAELAAKQGVPGKQLDPQRGVLLFGEPGTGKSLLLQALGEAMNMAGWKGFRNVNARALAGYYEKGGIAALEPFFTGDLCIHDIGTEQPTRHMGGKFLNVVGEVIERRWDNYARHEGKAGDYTHITTNLDRDDLHNYYQVDGVDRFTSRVFGMMRALVVEGPDRREMASARIIRRPIEPEAPRVAWTPEADAKLAEIVRTLRARKQATVVRLKPVANTGNTYWEKDFQAKLMGYTDVQLPILREKLAYTNRNEPLAVEPYLKLIDAEMGKRAETVTMPLLQDRTGETAVGE